MKLQFQKSHTRRGISFLSSFSGGTLITIIVSASVIFGCRDNGTGVQNGAYPPDIRPLTTLEKAVVSSGNSFGIRLFVQINDSEQNKNVFLSPFSVSMALGMTLNGADGTTLDSMKKVLGQSDLSLQEIDESYMNISNLLVNLDPCITMNIANSVWYTNSLNVLPTFLNDCRTYFDAEVASLDFTSPSAVQTINGWVNSRTNGKISTIIDVIPRDVVMYLINAIYFKGTWKYQFDPANTSVATFTTPKGNSPCDMMYQRARYVYHASGTEQIVDMAYGNGQFSMTVILPQQGLSIDEYSQGLTEQKWDALTSDLDSTQVDLYLPKFKLDYERALNDDLVAMGMGTAFFGPGFSHIATDPLVITEVKHKTFVEINEEGTEAAAVTSIGMIRTVAEPAVPVMRMDRPFICAIRERATGTILFLGKIVDPNAL